MTRRGLPHSDTPGSKLVCSSPRLIAAYCVLHRLLAPRHSPYALSSLIIGIETDTCRFENRRATVSLPTLTKHCGVFVDRKNYRLQDIQLSKITRGAPPLELHDSLTRGPSATPFARGSPFDAPRVTIVREPSISSAPWPLRSRPCRRAWPKPRRDPRLAKAGGEYRARTGDLLVANQALSQLS